MELDEEVTSVSEDEIDELLAREAGISVAELREHSAVGFTSPWESEVVADHESE